MLMTKKTWGLVVACLGLAICLIWTNSMNYLLNMDSINDKIYDMKLVTVSDYAIMGQLTPQMYERFRAELASKKKHTGKTLYQMLHNQERKVDTRPIVLFKEELEKEIKQKLTRQGGLTEEEAEIADMTFAFDNSKML